MRLSSLLHGRHLLHRHSTVAAHVGRTRRSTLNWRRKDIRTLVVVEREWPASVHVAARTDKHVSSSVPTTSSREREENVPVEPRDGRRRIFDRGKLNDAGAL